MVRQTESVEVANSQFSFSKIQKRLLLVRNNLKDPLQIFGYLPQTPSLIFRSPWRIFYKSAWKKH